MKNFVVLAERPGQSPERLQLVARSQAAAIAAAMELLPGAVAYRCVLEGQW